MKDETRYLIRKLVIQITKCCSLMLLISVVTLLFYFDVFSKAPQQRLKISLAPIATDFDISLLDNSKENTVVKYGYELFKNTPKYIGPENSNLNIRTTGNALACTNCHLQAGTKPFSAPLIGITNRFPQFRGRENKIGTIEERINGCMERSMNGKTLAVDGKEMQAFVAYVSWLSRLAPKDGKVFGQGFVKIEIPNRKVDLQKGKKVFKKVCVACHGTNGEGKKAIEDFVYEYPPLWGSDSYNNGAGMNRVITAAQFIKANMPYGTTYENPVLSDEEAYDVAGYINQQTRPLKPQREKDFPDLKKKPVSTPYPPYADTFSVEQHQLGPFQPIMTFYKQEYNIVKSK
ncbi:c-type cytochrome [Cellulophaga sp. F20128]|uniref:c-type cytochrome n=1 Tax=Cellulophaga sp. F20128 TaxID=2926413 RepID=UPI001FF286F3|nr:c-type cytochrome [Cellulophaga sp. F20128]MCK0157813.1 c-type cytochrome [Cellulophaga sp. F20128]